MIQGIEAEILIELGVERQLGLLVDRKAVPGSYGLQNTLFDLKELEITEFSDISSDLYKKI